MLARNDWYGQMGVSVVIHVITDGIAAEDSRGVSTVIDSDGGLVGWVGKGDGFGIVESWKLVRYVFMGGRYVLFMYYIYDNWITDICS